ncbi:hypothetical protein JW813_05610 [Clostridium botulinum]|uniref:hypothetical protein n=1 Tax=Clostridium botulinum TaxID=1491 RepID=UPI0021AE8B8E|nr:hypothetical protein [Clostridium botulinum]UZP04485.1 hypothetical protein JW813_05610 [Clostridium botulinum]UZP07897.1 hypothetical protein JYA71_05885 [Clostridium botulinum]UZP11224.1 hypothetical protein JYA74_05605 [Clostridium botulinum]
MKIKRMLMLILITIFIMPTSAFANTRNNNIRVSFNEININVNGVNFESDNMVYNDTIYLPICNLSKLLNLSVHYYESTNTIYIGQMPAGSVGESCKLYEEPKDVIPKGVNDIDVAFNNVNIQVHGESINSRNISYKNTTFVSLKSACEILNMGIGYYAPTLTAYVVKPVNENQAPYDNYKNEFSDKQKKLYVESGTGDMQGWQKIRGHEYEDIVEIHYKLNGNMKTVQVKDIRNIDLNKVVEWVDDNGIKRYNSVGYIYKMFNHFSSYSTEWCYNKFGNLYMDWLKVNSVDGERIVSKYLETQSQR